MAEPEPRGLRCGQRRGAEPTCGLERSQPQVRVPILKPSRTPRPAAWRPLSPQHPGCPSATWHPLECPSPSPGSFRAQLWGLRDTGARPGGRPSLGRFGDSSCSGQSALERGDPEAPGSPPDCPSRLCSPPPASLGGQLGGYAWRGSCRAQGRPLLMRGPPLAPPLGKVILPDPLKMSQQLRALQDSPGQSLSSTHCLRHQG